MTEDIELRTPAGTLTLDGRFLHSPKCWVCGGTPVVNEHGFNGCVLSPAGSGFVGVGHREAGVEEPVSLVIRGDGRRMKPAPRLTAGAFRIERVTRLLNVELRYTMEFSGSELRASARLRALADQKLCFGYMHQYSFTPEFSTLRCRYGDGTLRRAELAGSGVMWYWLQPEMYALENPRAGVAALFALTPDARKQLSGKLWDRHIYHKFYAQGTVNRILRAGETLPEYGFAIRVLPLAETCGVLDTMDLFP